MSEIIVSVYIAKAAERELESGERHLKMPS
jgi:hypothetical protein